ncbi:hypothetical protein EV690_2516 [Celerinatantimonas diazotrophica]|uniref:Uncharacterized protein n=1 Tax=Celerinatantimonas diazotrophica TaxID=412034 RepID=A0A4R1JBG9_9GAMM|nr:hypothetical protein EV690_2516 [Celerinatantimonas diazotrophica]CAG9296893.1 hypothetical protein CEDIAZO_02055 [Celerinatantimonas diazotrophica]
MALCRVHQWHLQDTNAVSNRMQTSVFQQMLEANNTDNNSCIVLHIIW